MTVRRHHITKKEADAVAEFAGQLLELLRLPAWTVLIMDEPCEDDAVASIRPIEGRHVAELSLAADWMKRRNEERLYTVVHEVCHLVHARVNDAVHDAEFHMHDYEFRTFWGRYRRETEYMVDHLAFFLSRTHCLEQAWEKAHGKAAR